MSDLFNSLTDTTRLTHFCAVFNYILQPLWSSKWCHVLLSVTAVLCNGGIHRWFTSEITNTPTDILFNSEQAADVKCLFQFFNQVLTAKTYTRKAHKLWDWRQRWARQTFQSAEWQFSCCLTISINTKCLSSICTPVWGHMMDLGGRKWHRSNLVNVDPTFLFDFYTHYRPILHRLAAIHDAADEQSL